LGSSIRTSQVYATTENETRTGILPREIAPKSKEDHDLVTDQVERFSVILDGKSIQFKSLDVRKPDSAEI
jgi:hypothetical protein